MEYTRQQLFELIWETPMVHLSKQLNISSRTLRDLCVKHGIPLPARGYWTRVQLGQADPLPELPYPAHNPVIRLPDVDQAGDIKAVLRPKKEPRQRSKAAVHAVLASITQLHDLRCIKTAESIKAHIKALEMKTHQSFDAVMSGRAEWPPTNLFAFNYFYAKQEEIPIVATARNAMRAVCLADQIIERLEQQGIEIVLEPNMRHVRYRMIAKKQGEVYEIDFRETWTKASKTPALTKLYRLATGREAWRDYIEVPKNILCVNLGGRYGHAFRDGGRSLEEQLDKVIQYIVGQLDGKIAWRQECAILEREAARTRAIRDHNDKILVDKKHQLEVALKESERLIHYQLLEEYLLRLEAAVEQLPLEHRKIGRAWITLVKTQAHDKNPLARRLRAFDAIVRLGAVQSGNYWHDEVLPESYDADLEKGLQDERD
jgi:hypothetical protein